MFIHQASTLLLNQPSHSQMASVKKHILESSVDTCRFCLDRISQIEALNAFITVLKDDALNCASESDKRISQGIPKSTIDGLPIAVKDNFCVRNVRTTCASKMLLNFTSPYDATVVKKLRDAGALIIGKTNLDEFAMGSGTVDSIFGPTKNVWGSPIQQELLGRSDFDSKFDQCYIAGGSSGGSAVAVATGASFASIGSDTGGSTRNPASYCGIVGYKPTYGVVSRHGLIPLTNSMDVPGILARKVEDVSRIFNVISGPDDHDSTTSQKCVEPVELSEKIDLNKITIGIPNEYHSPMMSSEILEAWQYIRKIFETAGATVKEVSMPHTQDSIVTYSILNQCEVASNMARYSGILFGHRCNSTVSTNQLIAESRWEGFGPVVRDRILAGNYFLLRKNYEEYFVKAMKVRRLIANDFQDVWSEGIHILLTPTTLTTAPLLSDYMRLDNRAQCATQDYCTQPANMAGCPAISVPICLSKDGLPISLQMMSRNFEDPFLLSVAHWLQSVVSFPHLVSGVC